MKKQKCPECGSSRLEWGYNKRIKTNVVQGRLNTNDVETFFYLGCADCSETVKIINCDDVINHIKELEQLLREVKR